MAAYSLNLIFLFNSNDNHYHLIFNSFFTQFLIYRYHKNMKKYFFLFLSLSMAHNIFSELPEMIIGKEAIAPGINLIFEGAIKDDVSPAEKFGYEKDSDIHIEVLANWNQDAPRGSPIGGFVAYLNVKVDIINQTDLNSKSIKLLPHLNMSDNLHYALNTKLPGNPGDLYTMKFLIEPPQKSDIGLHFDWREEVGSYLSKVYNFEYKDLNFKAIANTSRR